MGKKWISLAAFSLLLALQSCTTPVKPVAEFMPQSEFVFAGTIRQIHTSTINAEDVSRLAVVSVDKILSATAPFKAKKGELITVQLADPRSAKMGHQRIFFTRSWHFGSSIGVIEVGQVEAVTPETVKKVEAEITRVQEQQAEQKLLAQLKRAEVIVSGRVIRVRKSDIPPGLTEHDPNWHEADIQVEKVLKGNFDKDTVTIIFSKSNDVIWYKAPKFQPEMEGVWLLRSIEFAGERLRYPAAVDPDSFRPKAEQEKIQKLLAK